MEQQNHQNNHFECEHSHIDEVDCQQSENEKDISNDWSKSSRFLFYVKMSCLTILVIGMCLALYSKRYQGKPDVDVQPSSQFTPTYK
ncbi:MAG: hypothetical protein ORN85_03305 [Sediminibacterium sp.]|nr:hypothetical protein [Sediminibacterium sp.]